MQYICPICGKVYDTPAKLSECVQKCAKQEEEKNNNVKILEEKLLKTYETLKKQVNEFNSLNCGKQYASSLKSLPLKGVKSSDLKNFKTNVNKNMSFFDDLGLELSKSNWKDFNKDFLKKDDYDALYDFVLKNFYNFEED